MNQQSLAPLKALENHGVGSVRLQRKCACKAVGESCTRCSPANHTTQRNALSSTTIDAVPSIVHDVLSSPGQPLDFATRGFMGERLGHDFSSVRVHTDSRAAQSAQAVDAQAYTVGRDVVFGSGQYAPASTHGQRLLGHELAHVVQQSRGASGSVDAESQLERAADAAASDVVSGTYVDVAGVSSVRLARVPGPTVPRRNFEGSMMITVDLPPGTDRPDRLGYEKDFHGYLPRNIVEDHEKWHASHAVGPIVGAELQEGILLAPRGVNLSIQKGLENAISDIRSQVPSDGKLRLKLEITAHPNSRRLATIVYQVELLRSDGATRTAFVATVKVSNDVQRPTANVEIGGVTGETSARDFADAHNIRKERSSTPRPEDKEQPLRPRSKAPATYTTTPGQTKRYTVPSNPEITVQPARTTGVRIGVDDTQTARIAHPNAPPPPKLRIVGDKVVPLEEVGVPGEAEAPPTAARKAQMQHSAPSPASTATQSQSIRGGSYAAPTSPPVTQQTASLSTAVPADTMATTETPAAKPTAPQLPSRASATAAVAQKMPVETALPRPIGTQGQGVYGGAQLNSRPVVFTPEQQQKQAQLNEAVQQRASGIIMALSLTRARLEDISDSDEADKAEIWLVQNRPVIYQALFEKPGAAMVVQFHFERVEGRLKYRGATMHMSPDGQPPQPEKVDTIDIAGTGVKLFFPPVRRAPQRPTKQESPDPAATAKPHLVQSSEELIGILPNSTNRLLSYYTLHDARGASVMGPFRLRLGATDIEVTATALDQAMQMYRVSLESSLGERHQQLKDSIAQSQKNLETALTTHGNIVTKYWYRHRIALLDPHVMDKPREHEAAAYGALGRGDFRAASASLKAGEELVKLAEERIYQFYRGDDRIMEQELYD